MKNVVALVNLHNSPSCGLLTEKRPLASTTVLGRYAFIDFVLSNLTNTGIDDIGIMIKDHSRSVIKHMRSDNTYLKNSKTGYLNYMINEEGIHNPFYNTDLNNIAQNDYFLYDQDCKYVLICPVGIVYKVNYAEIIREHIKSGKLFSVVYSKVDNAGKDYFGLNKITVNALGNVQKIDQVDPKDKEALIGLKTYICNSSALKGAFPRLKNISNVFTLDDLMLYIQRYSDVDIHAIEFKGQVSYVNSLKKYYDISMRFKNLLINENGEDVFTSEWKIYTRTHDTRPVYYGENSNVKDSVVANGCTINGTVKNCILARNVTVEEGAVVENSIIFSDSVIKKGVHLKGVVADKLTTFVNKNEVIAEKDELIYIPQGETI